MNILYITNVYPTKNINSTPIVKNIYLQYKGKYPEDNIEIIVFQRDDIFGGIKKLRENIKSTKIDVLHAHFGGMYAFLASIFFIGYKFKKIITFHGTDIHGKAGLNASLTKKLLVKLNKQFSYLCFFTYDIVEFISYSLKDKVSVKLLSLSKCKIVISNLGVDYKFFYPMPKEKALSHLKLKNKKYILFVNNNNSAIKRESYAREIVSQLGNDYELLKLYNIDYELVPYYINASYALLITSETEGSPNIVREALACNLPIISVDVGDISEYIQKTENSIIIEKNDSNKAVETIMKNIEKLNNREDTRSKFNKNISYDHIMKKLHRLYLDASKQSELKT